MACWDTTACFKALCSAYAEYQKQQNQQTVQDLQRQIDVLLGVTSHGASLENLSLKELLYAESLSALVSVVNEPNLKNPMYLKTITALSHLANDAETKIALQTTFNLISTLISFALRSKVNTSKQLSIMTLQLLEKLSYRHKTNEINNQIPDLIRYLLKKVYSTSDHCLPCLGILANLCYKNPSTQAFIKSMDDVKNLYKTLFNYLSHAKKSYSIVSLSLLTSLVLEEDTGEKVFCGNNLINIIHLVFQTLISTESVEFTTKQYCIDLIVDLLNHEKTYRVISESNQLFSTYLHRILLLLHSTDPVFVTKIFELLNSFCSKDLTRRKLTQLFVKQIQVDEETQLPSENPLSPVRALLHWASQSEQRALMAQTSILAMRFLRDVLMECISCGMMVKMNGYVEDLLPLCMERLFVSTNIDDEKLIKQNCEKTAAATEILICLCKDDVTKQTVLRSINDEQCLINLVNGAFETYSDDLKQLRSPISDCGDTIVHMLYRVLELFASLKHDIQSANLKYSLLLQDVRLVPFLCCGMKSTSKYLVHSSLQIFLQNKNTESQLKRLGDSLTSFNKNVQFEIETLKVGRPAVQPYVPIMQPLPLRDITNTKPELLGNITALTEKLRKGLDIKDSKISDIMDYYEHKMAAMASREGDLQHIIDLKSAALVQSDHLLSQNRCRQAQSDAECLKLRKLLQDSERRCETDSVRMDEFLKTKNSLESQIAKLNEQLRDLETVADAHRQLLVTCKELTHKLETLQKSLVASEEENHSLVAMNDCLHKNSEKLKSKLECSNERIKIIESEVSKLQEHIVEKENSINALTETVKRGEFVQEEKQNEISQMHKQRKELEKRLKNLDKSLEESKHQVSTLDLVCRQNEETLKEKDEYILQLQDRVEKHAQIEAMINNLTSGKMKPK